MEAQRVEVINYPNSIVEVYLETNDKVKEVRYLSNNRMKEYVYPTSAYLSSTRVPQRTKEVLKKFLG